MIAFIYAAGRAMRLGPSFADKPKILIEFGGKSLLEWHVQRLTELGIKKLVVITGHQRELIRASFAGLQEKYEIKIKEVVNKDYAEGSVLSFHVSLPKLLAAPTPVLIMDGDVLYPTEILRRALKSAHRTVLLIDRNYSTLDDDPVLVPIRSGKPVDFIKKWKGEADLIGESIGFFKVDSADIPLLVEETKKRIVGEGRRDSYDDVLRTLVLEGRFEYEDVTGIPWTEIDFPEDIEFARTKVLPSILQDETNTAEIKRP